MCLEISRDWFREIQHNTVEVLFALAMNEAKLKNWLSSQVRREGYDLAVRELYGENSKDYFDKRRAHNKTLFQLYRIEKKI